MAVACGIDIIYIPGIARILRDELMLKKFFHSSELAVPEFTTNKASVSLEHLAGVIAAKEAFFKALGIVPKLHDVQIAYEHSGRPKLIVAPQWQTYKSCDVSISHDQDYAISVVLLEL